jgi:predicted transport protein
MPLFAVSKQELASVEQTNFPNEKTLQSLIESNLETVFNCRFVASEFPTGPQHAGRIDTLALSEDNNPVIIEYKKVESSELINQSLFYLHWMHDHRGDFEIAAQKALGPNTEVDWADIRVICIAPNYKKYDLHAAQVMGANLELWTYRLFKNESLYLEEVLQKSYATSTDTVATAKDPKMVAAGKKAAATRANATYTVEEHIEGKPAKIADLAEAIREFIMGLDPAIEESPKKFYIAYKISQNIACMELQKQRVILYLKLNPKEIEGPPEIARDVSQIGHSGTGDLELSLRSSDDFDSIKHLIELSYQKVGG